MSHLQSPVGLFRLSFPSSSNLLLRHWFVDCTNISLNNHCNLFPVLGPYKLIISLIAFINIVCGLKIYLHQTMQMRFVFVLKMFQANFNRDCNRDSFQCNRNRLHCDFV